MRDERSRPQAPLGARSILWIALAFLYVPILMMLAGAFVDKVEGVSYFTTKWFSEVIQDEALMDALINSLIVAFSSSTLATLLGSFAAIGLFRSKGKVRKILESLSVVSLIFPEIVFALALLSWFFVLGLGLGLKTVIIAHVSFSISYVMMTVASRLANMDRSLEDAARDLGASEWTVVRTVLLPMSKPAIFGGFILSFLLSFDDFLITYFVNGVGSDTLPVKLYTALKMGVSPKLNALSSLMFLFTLIFLFLFFRTSSFSTLFESNSEEAEEEIA
ncbi:ABC transporter permease [Bdellovibrio sp. HCB337]|uniref:ABC transporter permease n=1 Tax=Bdellovibrio sp. HCB337 TaxID=3394358 RepID=UPI0039A45D8B